jgi:16S rRNA (uracil1498-N3)-methyltransferase
MTHRYFSETPIAGDRAVLAGPEAHHLAGVMRVKPGEEVIVFDGSGAEFWCRVETVGKREVALAVVQRREVDREPRRAVTLFCALPKGDRQKRLIEQSVELGVRRFVPLRTRRAVVQPDGDVCERLRRAVLEASKQCGRNRLMEIGEACGAPPSADLTPSGTLKLIAHPGSTDSPAAAARAANVSPTTSIALLIGPEGGFSDEEAEAALAAGWQPVDLGPRILRIETAAVALTAWAVGEW